MNNLKSSWSKLWVLGDIIVASIQLVFGLGIGVIGMYFTFLVITAIVSSVLPISITLMLTIPVTLTAGYMYAGPKMKRYLQFVKDII